MPKNKAKTPKLTKEELALNQVIESDNEDALYKINEYKDTLLSLILPDILKLFDEIGEVIVKNKDKEKGWKKLYEYYDDKNLKEIGKTIEELRTLFFEQSYFRLGVNASSLLWNVVSLLGKFKDIEVTPQNVDDVEKLTCIGRGCYIGSVLMWERDVAEAKILAIDKMMMETPPKITLADAKKKINEINATLEEKLKEPDHTIEQSKIPEMVLKGITLHTHLTSLHQICINLAKKVSDIRKELDKEIKPVVIASNFSTLKKAEVSDAEEIISSGADEVLSSIEISLPVNTKNEKIIIDEINSPTVTASPHSTPINDDINFGNELSDLESDRNKQQATPLPDEENTNNDNLLDDHIESKYHHRHQGSQISLMASQISMLDNDEYDEMTNIELEEFAELEKKREAELVMINEINRRQEQLAERAHKELILSEIKIRLQNAKSLDVSDPTYQGMVRSHCLPNLFRKDPNAPDGITEHCRNQAITALTTVKEIAVNNSMLELHKYEGPIVEENISARINLTNIENNLKSFQSFDESAKTTYKKNADANIKKTIRATYVGYAERISSPEGLTEMTTAFLQENNVLLLTEMQTNEKNMQATLDLNTSTKNSK